MFEAIVGGKAYDFMFTLLESETVTQDDILHFHELVTFGQPELQLGKLRDVDVIITGLDENLPPYQDVPVLFEEFAKWLSESENKEKSIVFAVEAHARLVSIHPFRDGNGRVSRLVMNTILCSMDICQSRFLQFSDMTIFPLCRVISLAKAIWTDSLILLQKQNYRP